MESEHHGSGSDLPIGSDRKGVLQIWLDYCLPPQLRKKLLLIATDYFSKWIEAEAFASIKGKEVIQFVWKNIVCRFGIPQSIITDNGPQFDSKAYINFYHG